MRVLVEIEGVNRLLTYEAPDETQKGARVVVPLVRPGHVYESRVVGSVWALESQYSGPCKSVLKVLP